MTTPKTLRASGVCLLVGALVAASVILSTRAADEEDVLYPNKRDLYQLERMGGRANVLASQFSTWFDGLWHGRNLGYTLAVVGVVGFSLCYLAAHAIENAPPEESAEQ